MMRPRAPLASRLLPGLAMAAAGLLGCHVIFGIQDVEKDPASGDGGTGAGTPGVQGDFAFAIRPPLVRVPYEGITLVDVEITPLAGFSAPVTVSVLGAPDGMVTEPLTIAAGEVQGQIQIGATGPLVIGTEFELRLLAVSGDLAREDSVPAVVADRPGTLDAGFGAGGITEWDLAQAEGALFDVREVPGGAILVAGYSLGDSGRRRLEVARLLPTGELDPSFDGSGMVEVDICECNQVQEARSVARLSGGRVIAVGQSGLGGDQDIAVLRIRDNGAMDNVDGDDGEVRVDLTEGGDDEQTYDAVFDASERMIVTGEHEGALFVARLVPPLYDELDTAFATSGYVTLPLGGGAALAIDSAGRIVVAGWTVGASADVAVARLTAAGAPDPSFGAAGVATVSRSGDQRPVGLVLQPDGQILVAATDEPGTGGFLALRLDEAGAPDPSFGTAGVAAPTLATGAGAAVGLALLLDGRVVLGGNVAGAPLLLRLTGSGAPDPTFGVGGEQPINLGPGAVMTALGLTAEGKLLLAGVRGQDPVRGLVARAFN